MNAPKPTLRDRVAKLRTDSRVAAFSLLGPGGQVFDLVEALIAELDDQAGRIRELEARVQAAEAGALRPRAALTTQHPLRSR